MGVLEDINNMKNQGVEEGEIVNTLKERGISPKHIEEAFNQMRIKKAVSAESSGEEGMEPSIMNDNRKQEAIQATSLHIPKAQELEQNSEEFYTPQPPQLPSPPQPPQISQFNEELEASRYGNYTEEEYIPQEGYQEQEAVNYNTDTFIEIAEQVFSEKIKKEQKQISALNEFAILAETRISANHERVKRMEEMIDKLQVAILEKVSSYGRNLESIKNEMGMMQESFGKMVPSVHEHNQHQHHERIYEEPSEEEPHPAEHHHIAEKKTSKTKK